LLNAYGSWAGDYPESLVQLDGRAACGGHAISIGFSSYYTDTGAILTLNNPVDLTTFEKFQFSILGIGNQNTSRNGFLLLLNGPYDGLGAYARIDFQYTESNVYAGPGQYGTPKVFTKSAFTTHNNASGTVAFDWSKISVIVMEFHVDEGVVLIDCGPFFLLNSTPSRIAIYCQNIDGKSIIGKHAQFIGPNGTTTQEDIPKGPVTCNPGTWNITPTDADFVKWSDGQTTRAKDITVPTGGLGQGTVIFQSGTPPPPPNNNLAIAIAGLGIGAVALYFILRRK
jgi:hypothetical protein